MLLPHLCVHFNRQKCESDPPPPDAHVAETRKVQRRRHKLHYACSRSCQEPAAQYRTTIQHGQQEQPANTLDTFSLELPLKIGRLSADTLAGDALTLSICRVTAWSIDLERDSSASCACSASTDPMTQISKARSKSQENFVCTEAQAHSHIRLLKSVTFLTDHDASTVTSNSTTDRKLMATTVMHCKQKRTPLRHCKESSVSLYHDQASLSQMG